MIIINNDRLSHVDSFQDIIEHYGVKGMKWGKHRSNMRQARNRRLKVANRLEKHKENEIFNYMLQNAFGQEQKMAKDRHKDFKKYADESAKNYISVKKQKYIDKYSSDNTTKGLNDKGQRKYDKLKKKAKKRSRAYYNDIESNYQRRKNNLIITVE